MVKKFNLKSMVVGGIIGGMLTTGVGYAASQLTSIEVSLNPVNFMYNGEQLILEEGQESYIYDGSTYVPLRWLSESLGKTVEWDEPTRTITIADQATEEEDELNEENKQDEGSEAVAAQLTLSQETYAATDVLELTILNDGANTLSFGRLFNLDMLQDGQWVEVPAHVPVTMELIILGENDTFTQSIDLSLIELQEGTYRLTKHVFDEVEDSDQVVTATFEVSAE